MKRYFLIFLISSFFYSLSGISQNWLTNSDTLNKRRFTIATSSLGTAWTGSVIALNSVWFPKEETTTFHTFNDADNWLQMDKAGHFYSAYYLSNRAHLLYKWAGTKRNNALILGGIFGFGFETSFEILDGYAKSYGFSWSDITANALGTISYITQDLVWKEQKIKPKFSVHLTEYAKYRPNVLGSNLPERLLKDYNGQTYWLSFSPLSFIKAKTSFPEWINLSLGYSVSEKLVGNKNNYLPDNTTSNVTEFKAYRRYLLSLDIDLSKLPIKKPWLKTLARQFNSIKIPFPTVEFSERGFKSYGLYF